MKNKFLKIALIASMTISLIVSSAIFSGCGCGDDVLDSNLVVGSTDAEGADGSNGKNAGGDVADEVSGGVGSDDGSVNGAAGANDDAGGGSGSGNSGSSSGKSPIAIDPNTGETIDVSGGGSGSGSGSGSDTDSETISDDKPQTNTPVHWFE